MVAAAGAFYDELYAFKDYQRQAEVLLELVDKHRRHPAETLLDVGCGTGRQLVALAEHFRVEGVDLDERRLKVARAKIPATRFTRSDMCQLRLPRRFDLITCMNGTIAYARTAERVRLALAGFAEHLRAAGLLLLQPWYRSAERCPRLLMRTIDRSHIKVTQLTSTAVDGREALMNVHYLVGTEAGVEHIEELKELGIFSHDEYVAMLEQAGFEVSLAADALGPGGDVYVCKPQRRSLAPAP